MKTTKILNALLCGLLLTSLPAPLPAMPKAHKVGLGFAGLVGVAASVGMLGLKFNLGKQAPWIITMPEIVTVGLLAGSVTAGIVSWFAAYGPPITPDAQVEVIEKMLKAFKTQPLVARSFEKNKAEYVAMMEALCQATGPIVFLRTKGALNAHKATLLALREQAEAFQNASAQDDPIVARWMALKLQVEQLLTNVLCNSALIDQMMRNDEQHYFTHA